MRTYYVKRAISRQRRILCSKKFVYKHHLGYVLYLSARIGHTKTKAKLGSFFCSDSYKFRFLFCTKLISCHCNQRVYIPSFYWPFPYCVKLIFLAFSDTHLPLSHSGKIQNYSLIPNLTPHYEFQWMFVCFRNDASIMSLLLKTVKMKK